MLCMAGLFASMRGAIDYLEFVGGASRATSHSEFVSYGASNTPALPFQNP
jgi:hypothetical protein